MAVTVTPESVWRTTGPCPPDDWDRVLSTTIGNGAADEAYDVAGDLSLLCLGQMGPESNYGDSDIYDKTGNLLGLRPRPNDTRPVYQHPTKGPFLVFGSPAECVTEWRSRILDPTYKGGAYTPGTTTIQEFIEVYAPASDGNNPTAYANRICGDMNYWLSDEEEPTVPDLTFGRVPHPPHDRLIVTKAGPGHGYTQVPPRQIVGTCVHATFGYGSGEWYRDFFSVGGERADDALVDYYVDRRGRIVMLNDPRGTRAPWANGDANGLEGDGPAFVAKLGIGAINGRLVSIETEGKGEPMTAAMLASLAWLVAYWHDQAEVPHDRFPFNPVVGCVTQMQHWEFSSAHRAGSGCPFAGVQGQTDAYQDAAREIMKRHQTAPEYAEADPPGFEAWDGGDRQLGQSIAWACRRTFTARKATPVLKYADRASPEIRPPLAVSDEVQADYWLEAGGEPWILTAKGERVPVKDCTPVLEFKIG